MRNALLDAHHYQQQVACTWAKDILGHESPQAFEPVRLMPWSSVYRIQTSQGFVYLKIVAPPFDVELKLLPYLANHFPGVIPEVIASELRLCCLLMRDSGAPLRPIMKKSYQPELAISTLQTYVHIQQDLSNKVDELLKLGVPDWRLNTLPSHYLSLLDKKDFLIQDGLTVGELKKLQSLHEQVQNLCKRLAAFSVPETIEHGDMHDNNILINTEKKLIIHDWGDTVITHPFFSLCNFMHSAEKQHQISHLKPMLSQAYCDMWSKYDTKENLQQVLALTNQLREIKFVLSFARIAECPGMQNLGEYKGAVADALKAFIKRMHNARSNP